MIINNCNSEVYKIIRHKYFSSFTDIIKCKHGSLSSLNRFHICTLLPFVNTKLIITYVFQCLIVNIA